MTNIASIDYDYCRETQAGKCINLKSCDFSTFCKQSL